MTYDPNDPVLAYLPAPPPDHHWEQIDGDEVAVKDGLTWDAETESFVPSNHAQRNH